jgi:hypothetical protein
MRRGSIAPIAPSPLRGNLPTARRVLISFPETNPAGLAAGSRWSVRAKGADHRVNVRKALHPEWVPALLPACVRYSLQMGWFCLRWRVAGIPPGCK